MPTQIIGEFGTPAANSEWLEAEGQLAIRHVKKICGDPPPEMKLEIVWQEHELANYPTIGLVWNDRMRGTPWNYISRCEASPYSLRERRGIAFRMDDAARSFGGPVERAFRSR